MPGSISIDDLKAGLRGELIKPGDGAYDEARKIYNAMIDKKPGVIVRAANVADVISAVNFARENSLPLAIRGGGHNVGGFALVDDGVVVDLSNMRSVRVDPEKQIARVEGGCNWGDVDHAGHAFGLAVPAGILSTTGVGGLTLGGGIGYLTRKYGLTLDNLISADVVTADGKFVTASAEQNQDLFWALRGGGGNFGVVTSFEFKMHPVHTVHAGPIFFPVESAGEVLRHYREFMPSAPPELGAFFAFQVVPPAPPFPEEFHNRTACLIMTHYSGPGDQAEKAIDPIRKFAKPLWEHVGPAPHPAINSLFDGLLPYGQLQHYWKADYINEISDEAIAVHLEHGPKVPAFQSTMHIYPTHGAAQKIGSEETAYSYRDANYVHVIAAMYPDPADTPKNKQWVRDYWQALHPHSAGGAYINFLMEDDGEDRVRASFGTNYDRLVSIKNKYDPGNLFRVNQNIKPTK
jgi:FAD/FMN-containing dehydrogenase